MSDWFTEECLSDIANTFQELVNITDRCTLEELAVFRSCWNKDAMREASKRLPRETRLKLFEMIKELDKLDVLPLPSEVADCPTTKPQVSQSVPLYG